MDLKALAGRRGGHVSRFLVIGVILTRSLNFEILKSKDRKNCLCTAMLYDPKEKEEERSKRRRLLDFKKYAKLYERWMRFKKNILLKMEKKEKVF